jgi:hypothetical protein
MRGDAAGDRAKQGRGGTSLLESAVMRLRGGPPVLGLALSLVVPAAPSAQAQATGAAGGVQWKVPPSWTVDKGSSMRVATYKVPGAKPDAAGECPVFFFGPGQGGSVDANLERWSRQFEGSPKAETSTRRVNGLPVTIARISGTYLAPGGPAMQSQGKRQGYRLLGAIVEAPEGPVFFKLTGPAATVAGAERAFESLLASLAKGGPGRS